MHRLAKYDISAGIRSRPAQIGAQLLFGLGCGLAMIGLRAALDPIVHTAGPFAMVYPTVLIATLFGHWRAGLVAYILGFGYAWWYLLPANVSMLHLTGDPARVAINAVSAAVVGVLAEVFRSAVHNAAAARDAEIERRGMLLAELEHRTKNNFSLVASLLELQARRSGDPAVAAALEQATGRVHSFARAYANLADTQGEGSVVEMREYLEDVVERVTRGAFDSNVRVGRSIDACVLPRQVAVAIGLFTNEALTNCAKYAFADGRAGRVDVRFACVGNQWELTIIDDGLGKTATATSPARSVGAPAMGAGLMQAFARQALATANELPQEHGHGVRLAGTRAD